MQKLFSVGLAVIVAVVLVPSSASAPPDASPIDIAGIELAGSSGVGNFDVFGTIKCESAGVLMIDAFVTTEDITDLALGSNNGLECGAEGDTIPWVVTASGLSFVPGQKVHVLAIVGGAANGTDEEDHTLRHGS